MQEPVKNVYVSVTALHRGVLISEGYFNNKQNTYISFLHPTFQYRK